MNLQCSNSSTVRVALDNHRTITLPHLMLDNFDNIKAYWVILGKATAQTALLYGANDLDGTITDGGELIHAYAAEGEVNMTKQEIIETIHRAGFEAVERDTVYNRVGVLLYEIDSSGNLGNTRDWHFR